MAQLAAEHGVSSSYVDWAGKAVRVEDEKLIEVLRSLGVHADSDASVRALLNANAEDRARRLTAETVVVRGSRRRLSVSSYEPVEAELTAESGEPFEFGVSGRSKSGRRQLQLPEALAEGYHELTLRSGSRNQNVLLIRAPAQCPSLGGDQRLWGWMAQLYALRSAESWGLGDLGDLAHLASTSATRFGASFVLSSPIAAANPTEPQQPSPYYPSSRRYANPLHLRIEWIPEAGALPADRAAVVAALATEGRDLNDAPRLSRDPVRRLKTEALEAIFAVPRSSEREEAFRAFLTDEGEALQQFALFSALAELHGVPYQSWPEDLQTPTSAGAERARGDLHHRVQFHCWLQWLCREQLSRVQAEALDAGMPIGIIHDLPVGVDRGGADAWTQQDDLAPGMSVGAPPDSFSPRGQDWGLPPWRPDRLEGGGFAPYRGMLRSLLAHAGGLRIDHALGLFRLYWIPEGASPAQGAFVNYPVEPMLACLAVEASRAGAGIIAEDLGTVGEGVREALDRWGVYGSALLLFERGTDGTSFLPPHRYRRHAFASITTHDLPTAAGFWTDASLRARHELGLLGSEERAQEEAEACARDRRALTEALVDQRFLGGDSPNDDLHERVRGMHAFVGRSRSALVAVSLNDALEDEHQPNMPGTVDEYPNWSLPLASSDGRPLLLDEALDDPRLEANIEALRLGREREALGPRRTAGSQQDRTSVRASVSFQLVRLLEKLEQRLWVFPTLGVLFAVVRQQVLLRADQALPGPLPAWIAFAGNSENARSGPHGAFDPCQHHHRPSRAGDGQVHRTPYPEEIGELSGGDRRAPSPRTCRSSDRSENEPRAPKGKWHRQNYSAASPTPSVGVVPAGTSLAGKDSSTCSSRARS